MPFRLTDDQRPYFGLLRIDPDWDVFPLEGAILYFDGNRIRKLIAHDLGWGLGYYEYDLDLETLRDRSLLKPTTSRGTPKKLSLDAITALKHKTFQFYANYQRDLLTVRHEGNRHEVASANHQGIKSDARLRAWVEEHVKNAPPDAPARLAEVRGEKRKRVKYRPGDVFAIPLKDGTFAFGRILLDMHALKKARVWGDPAPTWATWGDVLIQIYKILSPTLDIDLNELRRAPRLPSEAMGHDDIFHGLLPIVGHLDLEPADMDLPEYVMSFGIQPYFEKGALRIPLPLGDREAEQLPKPSAGFGIWREMLRRAILGEVPWNRPDLRDHPERARILSLAGLSPEMSYDEMCAVKSAHPNAAELVALSRRPPLRESAR